MQLAVRPGPGSPGPTGTPAAHPGPIDATTARLPALEAGAELFLVGAGPELGHWQLDHAVRLLPGPDGSWRSGPVELPLWSVAEYKLAARGEHGDIWESGPNRYQLIEPEDGVLQLELTLTAPLQ